MNSATPTVVEQVYPVFFDDAATFGRLHRLNRLQVYALRIGLIVVLATTGMIIAAVVAFALLYLMAFVGVLAAGLFGLVDQDFPHRPYTRWDFFRYYLSMMGVGLAYCLWKAWKEIKKL